MAFPDDMVTLLRSFIFDLVEPYTYSDERLDTILASATTIVLSEVDFSTEYTVDLTAETITPATVELALQVLGARKAAVIILGGEAKSYASKGISIKDGPSTIDMKEAAATKLKLAQDAAAAYDLARTMYCAGDGMRGHAVVTPFNVGTSSEDEMFR